MKKLLPLILLFLALTYSNKSFSQIDVNLVDIENNQTIPFSEIFATYNLNKDIPTMVITWSGEWCTPCINLINRYNDCDLSLVNIITINVDTQDVLEGVLDKGYHLKWDKTINFHANIGEGQKGFDYLFNVTSAPLILYMEQGNINAAVISYSLYPYRLIETGKIRDVNFIWNSAKDLNGLAWSLYENNDNKDNLEEAKKWVNHSIELDKNYHNMDTHAALLFKTGEYTQALKAAKEAIELAQENDIDYSSTTDLINQIIEKL
jgi:tetratricopeptide (TPR) repeat protein